MDAMDCSSQLQEGAHTAPYKATQLVSIILYEHTSLPTFFFAKGRMPKYTVVGRCCPEHITE